MEKVQILKNKAFMVNGNALVYARMEDSCFGCILHFNGCLVWHFEISKVDEFMEKIQKVRHLFPQKAFAQCLWSGKNTQEAEIKWNAFFERQRVFWAKKRSFTEPLEALLSLPHGKLQTAFHPQEEAHESRYKVLIIEDSATFRSLLRHIIEQDTRFHVVGTADSAEEALRLLPLVEPHLLTLDIKMPGMGGLALLEKIMKQKRIPTIVVSAVGKEEGQIGMQALKMGAFEYVEKSSLGDLKEKPQEFLDLLESAAKSLKRARKPRSQKPRIQFSSQINRQTDCLIAIGASTGGTEAIRDFITGLPREIPPMLIVQHIPAGFSAAFAKDLNENCAFEVREAQDGDLCVPGLALVAPGSFQMQVEKVSGRGYRVKLTQDPPVNRHKPSIDYTFDSLSRYANDKWIAFLLTGMGADGAEGLLRLKMKGVYTVSQSEDSCVVYGMPKAAFEMGASCRVADLEHMPAIVSEFLKRCHSS